ncbi:MAG: hypothetical protein AAF206_07795 [Bacteroidota bacterium]
MHNAFIGGQSSAFQFITGNQGFPGMRIAIPAIRMPCSSPRFIG